MEDCDFYLSIGMNPASALKNLLQPLVMVLQDIRDRTPPPHEAYGVQLVPVIERKLGKRFYKGTEKTHG